MSGRKLLIDTNVFIYLEDQHEVPPEFAKLHQLCIEHSVQLFVHERAADDIKRDRNADRRKVSLSKFQKFNQLKRVSEPPKALLEARFGAIPKPNDVVDVSLLHALDVGAVDFLVSQDQGIHTRAKRCIPPIADRVLTVGEMVGWLRATFEPKKVKLPLIEEVPAHSISPADDIFDGLRDDYPEFDEWWRKKCVGEHRPCWAVTIAGELAGIVVRKEETHAEAKTQYPGPKILKVCTFKVKPKFHGEKLGELLLKQILWFAQKNQFDLVYLTAFDVQRYLIDVLEFYGFVMTGINARHEQIYEKPLLRDRLIPQGNDDLFDLARLNYPRFVARPPATAFYVPIRGEFHDMLFPELANRKQGELFGVVSLQGGESAARRPGNTIRKVYLCRASSKQLQPGSVLIFYRSQSRGYVASQCATSIGIVEAVSSARSLEDLVRITAKRSVYSEVQLRAFGASEKRPVKVIDFLLAGHLDPSMTLAELQQEGVVTGHPPQSICRLTELMFIPVRRRMHFGFEV